MFSRLLVAAKWSGSSVRGGCTRTPTASTAPPATFLTTITSSSHFLNINILTQWLQWRLHQERYCSMLNEISTCRLALLYTEPHRLRTYIGGIRPHFWLSFRINHSYQFPSDTVPNSSRLGPRHFLYPPPCPTRTDPYSPLNCTLTHSIFSHSEPRLHFLCLRHRITFQSPPPQKHWCSRRRVLFSALSCNVTIFFYIVPPSLVVVTLRNALLSLLVHATINIPLLKAIEALVLLCREVRLRDSHLMSPDELVCMMSMFLSALTQASKFFNINSNRI
jgi:hypothetical protein